MDIAYEYVIIMGQYILYKYNAIFIELGSFAKLELFLIYVFCKFAGQIVDTCRQQRVSMSHTFPLLQKWRYMWQ
jgi:hypothetical protein